MATVAAEEASASASAEAAAAAAAKASRASRVGNPFAPLPFSQLDEGGMRFGSSGEPKQADPTSLEMMSKRNANLGGGGDDDYVGLNDEGDGRQKIRGSSESSPLVEGGLEEEGRSMEGWKNFGWSMLALSIAATIIGLAIWGSGEARKNQPKFDLHIWLTNLNKEPSAFEVLVNEGENGSPNITSTSSGYEVTQLGLTHVPFVIEFMIQADNLMGLRVDSIVVSDYASEGEYAIKSDIQIEDASGKHLPDNVMKGKGTFYIYYNTIRKAF